MHQFNFIFCFQKLLFAFKNFLIIMLDHSYPVLAGRPAVSHMHVSFIAPMASRPNLWRELGTVNVGQGITLKQNGFLEFAFDQSNF